MRSLRFSDALKLSLKQILTSVYNRSFQNLIVLENLKGVQIS